MINTRGPRRKQIISKLANMTCKKTLKRSRSIHLSSVQFSRSVVSDSVRPHRQQPTRLPHPWDSPGKNTGVGCHFLLQCMKVKSESEVAQSCLTLSDPMDYSPPGSSTVYCFTHGKEGKNTQDLLIKM